MAQDRMISHVVGSLYNFSEAAGREIVSTFENNSNQNTSCHFNDSNVFTIRLSHNDDESLACLVNSINNSITNFIYMEKSRERDLFEDEKISRMSRTHPHLMSAALPERHMHAIKLNGERPLIEHENIIRRWSPGTESKELSLRWNLQLLGSIGSLYGCRVEHASDSADLLIKADREQDIENCITKLERLNKMMADEISFPRIHSFYILEGETSVSLQVVPLKDLNDRRPVTTLLPKGSLAKPLRDLCVLMLVKGSNILQVNLKPAASSQECRLWNDHVYSLDQAQGLVAAKAPKEPKTPIAQWVSELTSTDVQVDAFRPESATETQNSARVGIGYKEPLSPTKKPTTRRTRIPRGDAAASTKAFAEPRHGHDGKEATFQENVASFSGHQITEVVSTGKESESRRQPPNIEPPYMPPFAMPLRSLSNTPSRTPQQLMSSSSSWNVVGPNGKSGSLVDISVPTEGCVVIDKLQTTTEAKARHPKNTMNQKKARAQGSIGGDTSLVKSFEEIITNLLVLALPRTGRVLLAVDIGRLLLNQQYSSSEFKNRSFKTSEFSSVLPKGRSTTGFEPVFTNMLTAHSSEAESIVNLHLSQGRRLFQQQPASRKVTHVLGCKAKGGDQIVVEYDENRAFHIRGPEILMGTLDWHFPKRAWDARLRLTSERFLVTDYQRQVKGIVDNLKEGVAQDGQSLELWTKTIDDTLSIESITLCRETLHPVTIYPDLILHLTEHQDLQVRQSSESESIYSGSIQLPNVMVKANRVWWGAKVSSVNANTILKENITLDLGETAEWTPSSIINKGIVGDLFNVTKEIVTRIAHVGFYNRGEGSLNSKTTEKPSENTQAVSGRIRRVDPGYW